MTYEELFDKYTLIRKEEAIKEVTELIGYVRGISFPSDEELAIKTLDKVHTAGSIDDFILIFREWANEEANHMWDYYALEDDSKLTEKAKEYCKDMLWYGYLKGKADNEKSETEDTEIQV